MYLKSFDKTWRLTVRRPDGDIVVINVRLELESQPSARHGPSERCRGCTHQGINMIPALGSDVVVGNAISVHDLAHIWLALVQFHLRSILLYKTKLTLGPVSRLVHPHGEIVLVLSRKNPLVVRAAGFHDIGDISIICTARLVSSQPCPVPPPPKSVLDEIPTPVPAATHESAVLSKVTNAPGSRVPAWCSGW